MATRNISPVANNEGSIGTTLKKWATGFIKILTVDTLNLLTLTSQAIGFTIAGGTTSKTLTVADTLTLALGAANLKQFMNSAGTDLEWANGIKIITSSHDMSSAADQAITGVGFKPSAAIYIFTNYTAASNFGVGLLAGTTSGTKGVNYTNTFVDTSIMYIEVSSGVYSTAVHKSWDADGQTITWAKNGSPTGTCYFTAMYFR